MNSCQFGNSISLFKYNLLSFLIAYSNDLEMFYIPMETEPKPKVRTPKYSPFEIGKSNEVLHQLMVEEYNKEYSDLCTIKSYFQNVGIQMLMFEPSRAKRKYFNDGNRTEYFNQAINRYKSSAKSTVVVIDPDVGSDVGITRRYRSFKDRYVRKFELLKMKSNLKNGDFICYYQSLADGNRSIHKRISSLRDWFGKWVILVSSKKIQASMVMLFNDKETFNEKRKLIEGYFKTTGQ